MAPRPVHAKCVGCMWGRLNTPHQCHSGGQCPILVRMRVSCSHELQYLSYEMKVAEQGNAVGSIMCSVHATCCGGRLSCTACFHPQPAVHLSCPSPTFLYFGSFQLSIAHSRSFSLVRTFQAPASNLGFIPSHRKRYLLYLPQQMLVLDSSEPIIRLKPVFLAPTERAKPSECRLYIQIRGELAAAQDFLRE